MSYYINPYHKKYITKKMLHHLTPNFYPIKENNYSLYNNTYLDQDYIDSIQKNSNYSLANLIPNNLPDDLSYFKYNSWTQTDLDDIKIYDIKYYSIFDKYPLKKKEITPDIAYYGLYD